MKCIFSFVGKKIKLLMKILALVIIVVLWFLSVKYASPTGSFSIFFINGEVIPMSADEHIVARIADKNCKITHVRTKQFSKSVPFLKSEGKINYIVDLDFEYLVDWNTFTIEQNEKSIICTFKKLKLKTPVRYEIKERKTERGLFVNSENLETAEKSFFEDGGVFHIQIENEGKSDRFISMAQEQAKKSLTDILKNRVLPMLKMKVKKNIVINFADSLKAQQIIDLKNIQ